MWREAADIQTADMLKLPVPAHESITVVTKPSAYQQDMVADLGERAELIRRRMVEPREDNKLLKYFPQAILREKELIAALEKDAAHLQAHTPQNKDTFAVTILGQTYTERKAAGQAILDACTGMKDVSERIELGEYRGFPLTLWANTQNQKFQLTLRQALSHDVELGGDAVGNFSRMDHVLDEIGGNLEKHRAILENLTSQQQEAKEEVHRPFAQEQELTTKTQRLNVLRLALNMDKGGTGRERPQPEQAEEKPSIRGMLKRLEAEASAVNNAPQGRYDREVAI